MLDSANNKCYITDRTKEGTKRKVPSTMFGIDTSDFSDSANRKINLS